jgi:hypothetical protein
MTLFTSKSEQNASHEDAFCRKSTRFGVEFEFLPFSEKKQNTRTHIMTCQLRQYGGGAQRHRGCEASEIMFHVLVHVRTCLLAIFFSLCTGFEAVA